jgi:hypothetical protein
MSLLMKNKWKRVGLLVTLLGLGGWFLFRPIKPDPVQSESAEPATTPDNLIDFVLLEQAVPDENYEPIYPEGLEALDGQTVVVRGFMTPYDDLQDLRLFMILGFPTGCNFCAPPSVNQVVFVRQPERTTPYPYVDGPIEVTGELALWRKDSQDPAHRDDYFLYVMRDVKVARLKVQDLGTKQDHCR